MEKRGEPGGFASDAASTTAATPAAAAPAATAPAATEQQTVCEPALLALLVCPLTKTSLGYDAVRRELISRPERLAFPIRDGVPILVRDEARSIDDGSVR